MAHIHVMYGSWIWTEEPPWPPWASVIRATFWCFHMYQGFRAKLQKPLVTPNIEKADGGHIRVKLGDTVIETATGKVMKQEDRMEVLPLSYGCVVPTFISGPSVYYLIEVPRMWTLAVHNIVAQFLVNGVQIAVTRETADVRACIGNLKVACSEAFFHANVCVYNLSKASAVYRMGHSALALCQFAPVQFPSAPLYVVYTRYTVHCQVNPGPQRRPIRYCTPL